MRTLYSLKLQVRHNIFFGEHVFLRECTMSTVLSRKEKNLIFKIRSFCTISYTNTRFQNFLRKKKCSKYSYYFFDTGEIMRFFASFLYQFFKNIPIFDPDLNLSPILFFLLIFFLIFVFHTFLGSGTRIIVRKQFFS